MNTHSPPSIGTIIGIPTYSTPDVYTVKFKDDSIYEYTADLLSAAPSYNISTTSSSKLPAWIRGGALATLFLNNMSKPHHGRLQLSDHNEWHFYPGKSTTGLICRLIVNIFWILLSCFVTFFSHSHLIKGT